MKNKFLIFVLVVASLVLLFWTTPADWYGWVEAFCKDKKIGSF